MLRDTGPAAAQDKAKPAAAKQTASAPDHAIVPGFERFFGEQPAKQAQPAGVDGGRLLLTELNCTACHEPSGKTPADAAKKAPLLTGVGGRIKPAHLRNFLADPHAAKPGTTMPSMFAHLPAAERSAQVDAITQYLLSIGPREPEQEFPTVGAHQRGEELFHQVGCAVCHGSRKAGVEPLATSVPLPDFMEKYTLASLSRFLLDPLHVRPAGRMPSLSLAGTEARDIASYLLKGLPEVANVKYAYYEGNFNSLPDFSKLTPKATGGTSKIDETLKQRGDQFALRFEGFLRIDQPGDYTFFLHSDDGSRLLLDGKVIVDNGGVHPPQTKQGRAKLDAGWKAVVVEFFEAGGGEELTATYEGPGISRRPIADSMSVLKDPPRRESLAIAPKPELIAKGRELFASVGCASCHTLQENGKAVESKLFAPVLRKLDASHGCLPANAASAKTPRYRLSAQQRAGLAKAIAAQAPSAPQSASPADQIADTLTRFNCYACHQRGEIKGKAADEDVAPVGNPIGGVEPARDALFTTTMKEMGDEGRLPPSLDGVGAKLRPEWMRQLFDQGANDRPYMHTRMPRFGLPNVGHLAQLFPAVDKLAPATKPETNEPLNRLKNGGWEQIGNKGFGCVKCHKFGPFPAEGIQAMDLATMSQRLNEDWFKRYVRNPQEFRRGTRMPSAWPPTGKKSLLKNILGGDVDTQIHGVWMYLTDGKAARTPYGMVTGSQMLTPYNEAIIYRNFIQGAGPRAIGVGYPENRHLAFDANQMRIALIWQGSYINAQRHRSGRGEGFEPPAGTSLVKLPEGVPFARLKGETPWPKQSGKELGYQFRGYRLSKDQRPTFLYDFGSLHVEDFPTPVTIGNATILRRTLTLKPHAGGPDVKPVDGAKKDDTEEEELLFRIASGEKVTVAEDGWFTIDGALKVRIDAPGSAVFLRKQGTQTEVMLKIKFSDGQAKFVQDYSW